ncbi:TonB-dependent receptor [Fulvivirga lutea]|uniref:TonB-dependent receptor plug domain-containing protein n=1 Tax=Fulvivirga lutea TaxID=2810512 RepID=A0A974WFY0_9BACT|nr:TonB-dependent receptor [Fulvivirga lutea]QSE96397.1 TonB-dependent receptor plug domain-containing protein [Fulvivirga lutea]
MRLYFLLLSLLPLVVDAQISVVDEKNKPIEGVSVQVENSNKGVITDESGHFNLNELEPTSDSTFIIFSHVAHESFTVRYSELVNRQSIQLKSKTSYLEEISISGEREKEAIVTKIQPKSVEALTTPFQEFNKILATLPGVSSNNELSSTYSVRGGNYDENLIYVNDIPIYRPFLVSNGQQEGLSFINNNLVSSVQFSAGGWQPKYGDKLSSVLNVTYKEPEEFHASASIGLLGGSVHAEGVGVKNRMSYALGVRHKSSQYLLNTLETQGQYLPRFTDYQSIINFKLGKTGNEDKTKLSVLSSYARNRYLVRPESRETEFGNFNQSLRLFVAFAGEETLEYDTYQIGTKLTHSFNSIWSSQLVGSAVYAIEREYTDVEGGYRLCDVDKNVSSSTFNDCVFIRGIGTNYDYGRNNLTAELVNLENRNTVELDNHKIEFGFGYSRQLIDDQLQEYSFTDSADYVIDVDAVQSKADLASNQYFGFIQNTITLSKKVFSTIGVRANYWDLNGELLISPRAQITFLPNQRLKVTTAIGAYSQPPFYRELRAFDGSINKELKAQKSIHFITGLEYNVEWWGRPFVIQTDAYFKRITDVVPYEVENVKIRYYANNNAKAFATGLDMRVSGEFVEGVESWFSLGILNTQEQVEGDGNGYIRRPTDQRINAAIFFQDHFPNNPDMRVSVNLFYGSGLPFGPPREFQNRNSYDGGNYTRLDIGFSRLFYFNKEKYEGARRLTISAEILNLFGTANPISYTWISDVNNDQFAVPNSLSARFFNIRATINI